MHERGTASLRLAFQKLRLCPVHALLLVAVILPFFPPPLAHAADSIVFIEKKKLWVLQSGDATYAFGVNERGELQHLYWGKRLSAQDFSAVYSSRGCILDEWHLSKNRAGRYKVQAQR